jgi:uncharacterized C2H2 Zn-finger protein
MAQGHQEVSMVHTCPRCELRFTTAAELTDHLDRDHRLDVEQMERLRYSSRPGDDGERR